jgi:hypothetical protein
MRIVLAAILTVSTAFAQAPPKTAPVQGPPPKNLTVRPDGHVSANEDPANPGNFEIHIVKQGETLSAIAGEVLKDPRLWPQLWEQNEHIINPHWIYPNDKILIRPVTVVTEAKPPAAEAAPAGAAPAPATPQPPAPEPAPEPQPEAEVRQPVRPAFLVPPPPPPEPGERTFTLDEQKPTPEVKLDDIYCSGFVKTAPVSRNLTVTAKFNAASGILATDSDYVYLSQGSEDGIVVGNVYDVIRATRTLTNPTGRTKAERDLGMHYLEIAYVRVTLTQADFSLARVIRTCGDAVEIGDVMLPFEPAEFPQPQRPRKFDPLMTTGSGITGEIITTKTVLLSFGSNFAGPMIQPGVGGGGLGVIDRGIAAAGSIVYINLGQDKSVKPGDIFIAYRSETFDGRLFSYSKDVNKLKAQRIAIGELIVLKVGERASSALVTYSSDSLSLGDSVERR